MPRLPLPPLYNACPDRHFDDFPRVYPGDRVFPGDYYLGGERRKAVCKRCCLVMEDAEPSCSEGEFFHLARPHQTRALRCPNDGKSFTTEDLELVPFMRKSRRRFLARNGIRP